MAMDVERLIECVKSHVYLYDLGHREYKNTPRKTAVWEKIAAQLNENSETVKLKWKTVRDGYIKYKKQLKEGKKVVTYIWSSQLKFLDDYQVSRKSKAASLSHTSTLVLSELSEEETETPTQSYSPVSIIIPSPSESDSLRKEPSARRKRKDQEKNGSYIKTKKIKTETGSYDATDHLFLSYSETFKTFSPRQRALLKVELAKLFSKAELNALDNSKNLQESFVEGSSPGYGMGRNDESSVYASAMCTVDVEDDESDENDIEFVNPTEDNGRRTRRNRHASDTTG